jgi:predicted Zn-dependent protease
MHFAANVESIDLRGATFCAACAAALPPHLLAESAVQP